MGEDNPTGNYFKAVVRYTGGHVIGQDPYILQTYVEGCGYFYGEP